MESSSEPKIKPKHVLFCIEGCKLSPEFIEAFMPDIAAAIELAKANECAMEDFVISFEGAHLEKILKISDPMQLKKMVYLLLDRYDKSPELDILILEKIITPYKKLYEENLVKELPEWLLKLNAKNSEEFKQNLIKEFWANSDISDFDVFTRAFKLEIENLNLKVEEFINPLSAQALVSYLETHPEINTVYALVGREHVAMPCFLTKDYKLEANFSHSRAMIDGQAIDLYFFGGTHGDMEPFNRLEDLASQNGLIGIKNETKTGTSTLSEISTLLQTSPKFFDSRELTKKELGQLDRIMSLVKELGSYELNEDSEELYSVANSFLNKHEGMTKWLGSDINYLNYLEQELEDAVGELEDQQTLESPEQYEPESDDEELAGTLFVSPVKQTSTKSDVNEAAKQTEPETNSRPTKQQRRQ